MLKALNHTGIPKVVDSFSSGPCHYIVMEYVVGRTMEALVEAGPPDEKTVIRWAVKLCDILEYLHNRPDPVIFRDLKPANIMVTPRGRVLLIDFGIARLFNPLKSRDTATLGTPGFAAPEQYGTAQSDGRSDIYSLGATIYHLLTGEDLAAMHFQVPPVRKFNRAVSPALEKILTRCLEAERSQRYEHAGELRENLEKAAREPFPASPAPSPLPPLFSTPSSGTGTGSVSPSAWGPDARRIAVYICIFLTLAGFFLSLFLYRQGAVHKSMKPDPFAVFSRAIMKVDIPQVQAILKANPRLAKEKDQTGMYAIQYAVESRSVGMVKILIDHGADVNTAGGREPVTPLYTAAYRGYKDIAAYLLSRGAQVEGGNSHGYTPLSAASEQGHMGVVTLLLTHGAEANTESDRGAYPLAEALRNKHWEIAAMLIKSGAGVNRHNSLGILPLNYAVMRNNPEEIDFLVRHGARVEERDKRNGVTPLMQAAHYGHLEALKSLISHKANVNAGDQVGRTALHFAALKNRAGSIEILAAHGAKLDAAETDDGWRPLHSAAYSGSLDAATMLVAKGADIRALDRAGKTPLDCAENRGQARVAGFLREMMKNPPARKALPVTAPASPERVSPSPGRR
jgi:ankyrin repeat protein